MNKSKITIKCILFSAVMLVAVLFYNCQLDNMTSTAVDTDTQTIIAEIPAEREPSEGESIVGREIVSVLTAEDIANAVDLTAGSNTSRSGIFTIYPFLTPKYVPPHTNGDREYAGHGPIVYVNARLHREYNTLYLKVYMYARETTSDWTTATGTRTYCLFASNVDFTILSDTYSYGSYTDTDHYNDYLFPGSNELVSYFMCTGDTSGNEAGTKTGVVTALRGIRIRLK